MNNPCNECIVDIMCKDPCDSFISYLTSYDWVELAMKDIMKGYPTSFKEMAAYFKLPLNEPSVIYSMLYELKEELLTKRII